MEPEYIEREVAMRAARHAWGKGLEPSQYIEIIPAADVAPVVHCKDCEYSYDEIRYLCCSHGVCTDCEVPPNFYCAEGKRKENDE